jgi:LPXTG-motif cell wall-anchored protein
MRVGRRWVAWGLGAAMGLTVTLGVAGTASADPSTGPDYGAVVKGEVVSKAPLAVSPAAVAVSPEQSSGPLPLTGGDVVELSAFGVALIGAGAILVRRTRRRA